MYSINYVEKSKDGIRHIGQSSCDILYKYFPGKNQIHKNAYGREARLAQAVDTFTKGSAPTHHVTERFIQNGNTYKAAVKRIPLWKRALYLLKVVK